MPDFADDSSGFDSGKYLLLNVIYYQTVYFIMWLLVLMFIFHSVSICKSNIDSVMLLESIFYGIWALNLVFIVCEMGQRASNNWSSFEEEVIQLHWYLYPIKIQRMLIPLMLYAQKPVVFEFFGKFSCSREQFKKVIHFKTHIVHDFLCLCMRVWWTEDMLFFTVVFRSPFAL